ncbi:hypothetical protein PIB30_010368 [Stylosanthes scabra]|uniref:Uncharacterized protein n=1 Tax=Stylosanthes scabra TaxID=79078 RepID=A0ABU6W421_9FABA|nr:hypothetical protein [Stylosanthes scabra]
MSHRKTPVHKRASASRNDPPLSLSQVPLRKWFASKEVWEDFQKLYSKMPILKPRYLTEGLLLEDKYPEFWWLLDIQGLRSLLFLQERHRDLHALGYCRVLDIIWAIFVFEWYYPHLMAAASTTLRIRDDLDENGYRDF